VLYGAGISLESIVRGTLPPAIKGRIAMPSVIAQAAARFCLRSAALTDSLAIFLAAAACDLLLVLALFVRMRASL
jgi:hypothetical protein